MSRGNVQGKQGMDPISQLFTQYKIPIGPWGAVFFKWIQANFTLVLRSFADGLTWILEVLVKIGLDIPPLVIILAVAGLAWYLQKSWKLALGTLLGLLFILNQGLWKQTVETIVLVVASAGASMAIGVPIGIWAAHKPKVYRVLLPILDLM
jgi:glycine betaine/proline transport system permease protein